MTNVSKDDVRAWIKSLKENWREDIQMSVWCKNNRDMSPDMTYQCQARRMDGNLWAFVQVDVTPLKYLEGELSSNFLIFFICLLIF